MQIAGIPEALLGGKEQAFPFFFAGHPDLSPPLHFMERRSPGSRQLIAGNMIGAESDGMFKRAKPSSQRLSGYAVDKINPQAGNAAAPDQLQGLFRLARRVTPL